ncbi:hypothetical protein RI054_28g114280 [Pseudoscourfieldia marina]
MLKTDEKHTLTELTRNEKEARAARITAAELLRDDALARRDEVQRASLTDEGVPRTPTHKILVETAEKQLESAQKLLTALVDTAESPDSDQTLVLDKESDVTAEEPTTTTTRYVEQLQTFNADGGEEGNENPWHEVLKYNRYRVLDEGEQLEQQHEPQQETPVYDSITLTPQQLSLAQDAQELPQLEEIQPNQQQPYQQQPYQQQPYQQQPYQQQPYSKQYS